MQNPRRNEKAIKAAMQREHYAREVAQAMRDAGCTPQAIEAELIEMIGQGAYFVAALTSQVTAMTATLDQLRAAGQDLAKRVETLTTPSPN